MKKKFSNGSLHTPQKPPPHPKVPRNAKWLRRDIGKQQDSLEITHWTVDEQAVLQFDFLRDPRVRDMAFVELYLSI
jgi:hypothetical protein